MMEQGCCTRPRVRRGIAESNRRRHESTFGLLFTVEFQSCNRTYERRLQVTIEGGEAVDDNPTGWVNRHIEEYVETDGRKGQRWSGVDTLLLTTRGRKSGKLRRTALIYGVDESNYV